MAETARKFEIVEEPDEAPSTPKTDFNAQALFLALSSLSKRALIALDNLFCLLTVFSVFWLCLTLPHPDGYQLLQLGGYAAFVLAANLIVHRHRG